MISIIVCSRKPHIDSVLEKNIQDTIGAHFEVIWIDNSENKYSLFSAYNHGVELAKGDILCFIHEDIIFHSNDWGKILENLFMDKRVGLVGIYGAHAVIKGIDIRTWFPASSGQLLQGFNSFDKPYRYMRIPMGECSSLNPQPSEGVAVDGLFLSIPRHMFDTIRFDTENFNGFHGYDWDICLQVIAAGKKVLIAHDILIEHKSEGYFNEAFLEASEILAKKWDDMLPVIRGLNEEDTEDAIESISKHTTPRIYKEVDRERMRREIREAMESGNYKSLSYKHRKFLSKHEYKVLKLYFRNSNASNAEALNTVKRYLNCNFYTTTYKLKLIHKFLKFLINTKHDH